jgi:hypothetical protein
MWILPRSVEISSLKFRAFPPMKTLGGYFRKAFIQAGSSEFNSRAPVHGYA